MVGFTGLLFALLVGCSSPTAPSISQPSSLDTNPSPPRGLGLYEISFSGVSSGTLRVTAQPRSSTLSTQTLSSASSLTLALLSQSSVTVGAYPTGYRTLSATFQVAAPSALNLSFIAVHPSSGTVGETPSRA